jgi:long-chain acyl-CoA synthetase
VDGLATIVYGGAPMYLADMEEARAGAGPAFAQIYGQGESPMTISVLPKARDRGQRPSRAGASAWPRWAWRSRWSRSPSARRRWRGAAGGEVGEVCVRGEVVMAGYWNQPPPRPPRCATAGCGPATSVRLDDEGFLTLMDRSKDLVISGGNNIYPREVEEVLLTHPGVAEVSVIGRPDPEWGESLVAYVVVPGAGQRPANWTPLPGPHRALQAAQAVPFCQRPAKNNYGKVLKTELRAREAALRR